MNESFVTLHQRDGPPRGPPAPPINRPPQPGPPNLPSALPLAMRQNPQAQSGPPPPPQHQPMMQAAPHTHIPPPPPEAVPRDLQPQNFQSQRMSRLSSEISDLRSENLTESDAREHLSTYTIVRLIKIHDPHEVDEEGYPAKPTWERVRMTVEKDISQQEARRQVRNLNKTTKPVIEKKSEYIPAIQRQLERAQERLSQPDLDKRYCYTLVQFESKKKRLDDYETQYHDKHSKRDKHKKEKRYASTSKKNKSKHRYETAAITAYFKRTPTKEQNGIRMLEEQQAKKERKMVQPQSQAPMQRLPIQQALPQQAPAPIHPQNFPPQQPLRLPPAQQLQQGQFPPQGQLHQQMKVPPQGAAVVAVTKEKGKDKGKKAKPNDKKEKGRHSSESSSSGGYEYDSEYDASDAETPPSSISFNSSFPKHRRGRSSTPVYQIPAAIGPHLHTRKGLEYILHSYPPGPPLSIPLRTKTTRRVVVTRPDEDGQGYSPRRAPPPRIIQEEYRHVPSPEVRREVLRDDLGRTDRRIHRLRLNAIHRGEDVLLDNSRIDRLGEDILHRDLLERELLEESHRWPEPRAQHFMRARVNERIDESRRDNPVFSTSRRELDKSYIRD